MDGYPRRVGPGPAIFTPTVEVVFVGRVAKNDAEGVVRDLEWSPIPIQPLPDRRAANLAFSDRSAEVKLHLTGLSPRIGAWLRAEALTNHDPLAHTRPDILHRVSHSASR